MSLVFTAAMSAMRDITRRGALTVLFGGAASVALAEPVLRSPRPMARPDGLWRQGLPAASRIVADAQLGPGVGFAVSAGPGQGREVHNPLLRRPPASVAKIVTALYALEALGPAFRYRTDLVATGPLVDGWIEGDLVLAGSGDPTLDTDMLADLAGQLVARGLRGVRGAFRVWAGALPRIAQIDTQQTEYAGYNPTITGLNLNYNRVHFEWRRDGGDYQLKMDARAERFAPDVRVARIVVSGRDAPVFDHEPGTQADLWSVARSALGEGGARWLPVRLPALYAGEVFAAVAGAQGLRLPAPQVAEAVPAGALLARHESAPLTEVVRDCLRYSTNLTAEVLGLTASRTRGAAHDTLAASAAAMNGWARERLGARHVALVDHSGLGGASRITASDMVRMLEAPGVSAILRPLLRPLALEDPGPRPPRAVLAKTGTLDFVSALAGYVTAGDGTELAFAIFTGDLEARAAAKAAGAEIPPGARSYNTRAKLMHRALIARWAAVYGSA